MRARGKLYIWQKLWALGLVFLVFFAIPTGFYLQEVGRTLARSERELAGMDHARAAVAVAGALAAHRAWSAAVISGDTAFAPQRQAARDDVDARLAALRTALEGDERMAPRAGELATAWQGLAAADLSRTDSHGRHGELIEAAMALREALLDDRGLSFDADPRLSHAIAAALVHAPQLVELMGQAQAQSLVLLAARVSTAQDRATLAATLERVKDRAGLLRARIVKAGEADADLRDKLAAVMADADAQLASFLRTARVDVVFSSALERPAADHSRSQSLALAAQQALAAATLREVERLLTERARGDRVRIVASVVLIVIAVIFALGFGIWTGRSIARPLGHAVRVADGIAAGKLDHAIDRERARNAEAARLMGAFAEMQAALSKLVGDIQGVSAEIHRASDGVATGNLRLAERTEEQASSLQETAASMEQLTAAVRRNAEHAAQASQAVQVASASAGRGDAAVAGVVESMATIRQAAGRIADIIAVIDGIAFQTNILALNAAVEAARAGEQGRGFAVVAAEVRSLAQRSATAAREIKALIEDSTSAVARGSERVDEAGRVMHGIDEAVRRVSALFGDIAAASAEQGRGIEQVNRAVGEMDRSTQENAAMVGEASSAAEALQAQARRLADLVARFRLAGEAEADDRPLALEGRGGRLQE